MTPEKRETAIKWLTEEVRSLRMAPKINGCGPENWEEQLEVMETCLEAVRECDQNATEMRPGCKPLTLIDREAWVSVDERLPEPNSGAYWVAKKKRNGEWQMKLALFCDYGYAMPVDGKTDVTWRDWDYTKIRNVSHWMPLPEPPKED